MEIGETLSDPMSVQIGIPQGTVLGPILFSVYINALTNMDIEGTVISYADDTVLIFNGTTWDEVKQKLSNGFNKVKNLLDDKTNYIPFSLTQSTQPSFKSISIKNLKEEIIENKTTKYLGVVII